LVRWLPHRLPTKIPSESVWHEGLYHGSGLPEGITLLIYFAALWI